MRNRITTNTANIIALIKQIFYEQFIFEQLFSYSWNGMKNSLQAQVTK